MILIYDIPYDVVLEIHRVMFKWSYASCKHCNLCCMGGGHCYFLKWLILAGSLEVKLPVWGFVWSEEARGVVANSLSGGAVNGSVDQYQVAPVHPNLLGVHNPVPDGTEPDCQDAWNSQSISQNCWKYGIGQEPVQMAMEGWSGLQALPGIGWAQIQMVDGICQKCSSLLTCLVSDCLCMRKEEVFQNILLVSGTLSPL